MLFIGHTRFSLFDPESSSWLASNGSNFSSIDEYREYLFSDERLEVRTTLFIDYSLPILAQASIGYEYIHVVSYSNLLPEKFERRLLQASELYPFLKLDKHIDGKGQVNLDMLARKALSSKGRNGGVYGNFRLDDDDLLSVDFFKNSSKYLTESFVGFVVSYGAGITAIYHDGDFYYARMAYSPLNSMGQLRICAVDKDMHVVSPVLASHNRVDRYNPVVLDSRDISFLWVRHGGQDTSLAGRKGVGLNEVTKICRELGRLPKVPDFDVVKTKFPSIDTCKMMTSPGEIVESSGNHDLKDSSASIDLKRHGLSRFLVEGRLNLMPGSDSRSVLARLVLEEKSTLEEPKDAALVSLLRTQGIMLSPNDAVGYFKYIGSSEATKEFDFIVELPNDVIVSQIHVSNWNNMSADNELLLINVTKLE